MTDTSPTTNILQRLRDELPTLSTREARAARHLMANYPVAGLTTVAEFAEQSGVSTATVLRLVKRLDFAIYADFQAALRVHIEEQLQSPLVRLGSRQEAASTPAGSFLDQFLDNMAHHLTTLRQHISRPEFEAITALLSDPRRDVHVLGGRYSSNLARYFTDLLIAVRGRVFLIDGQTQKWPQYLLDMNRNSVLVTIDVRRYQHDVIEFTRAASKRGATVVLLSDTWQSPASRVADHVLDFPVTSPSIFDVLTIGLAVLEALVGAVANSLGVAGKARIEMLEELRKPLAPGESEVNRTKSPNRASVRRE
ncbi:MAG: MurR/RpiR family transcriptional regulator [Phyllobacterium sp.]